DRVGLRVLDPADDLDRFGLDLERLALALGLGEGAGTDDRAAGGEPLHLGLVVGQRRRRDHLDRREAGAVADVDEAQPGLGVAPGPDPAADRHLAADRQLPFERMFDADCSHPASLPGWYNGGMAIALAPAALERVRGYLAADPSALGLRFGVRRTGCSGWGYLAELATDEREGDTVFEFEGIRIYV